MPLRRAPFEIPDDVGDAIESDSQADKAESVRELRQVERKALHARIAVRPD
jgi:hypothetical protein